jgi:hypothetical protein
MVNKGNVVLYLDKELVSKSKELGFNLSKTFENHLKQLIMQFSKCNSVNNFNSSSKSTCWCGRRDLNPNGFESQGLRSATAFLRTLDHTVWSRWDLNPVPSGDITRTIPFFLSA